MIHNGADEEFIEGIAEQLKECMPIELKRSLPSSFLDPYMENGISNIKALAQDAMDLNYIARDKLTEENSNKGKPVVILMKTEMGNGVDFMMGTHKWHGNAPNDEQLENALSQNIETLGDY